MFNQTAKIYGWEQAFDTFVTVGRSSKLNS